jgi:hypothetical protein
VYGTIVDKTSSMHPICYDEIMQLDSQLNKAYQQVPESMKVHSSHDLRIGTADPGPQILADLCYQKIPMRSSSTVSCFCEALSHHAILVRIKGLH